MCTFLYVIRPFQANGGWVNGQHAAVSYCPKEPRQVSTFPVVLAADDVAVKTQMQTHLKDLIETVGMTGGQGSLCLKKLAS